MNGKKFVLLFFVSAILVSILATYLGMQGMKAKKAIEATQGAQSAPSR